MIGYVTGNASGHGAAEAANGVRWRTSKRQRNEDTKNTETHRPLLLLLVEYHWITACARFEGQDTTV